MVCPRCQTQLPNGSVACNRCGLMFSYQPQQQVYQQPPCPQPQYQQPQYNNAPPLKQKKSVKKLVIGLVSGILGLIVLAIIIPLIILNLPKEIDYGDAEAVEKALNDGKNLNGAIVKIKVSEYKHTLLGDNIWAGKHLNFYGNIKNAEKGDTIIVKIKSYKEFDGSWLIKYSRVRNAHETSSTIKSD